MTTPSFPVFDALHRTNLCQILDFGAVRDGRPPEDLGRRILLDEEDPPVPAVVEEEA